MVELSMCHLPHSQRQRITKNAPQSGKTPTVGSFTTINQLDMKAVDNPDISILKHRNLVPRQGWIPALKACAKEFTQTIKIGFKASRNRCLQLRRRKERRAQQETQSRGRLVAV